MNSGVSESTTTIRPGIIKGGLFRTAQGTNLAFTFVLLTSLFLLWGFCNGMIDILNKHFQDTLRITKEQSGLVQAANYLAYFLMAVPAGFIAKKFGYKGGILVGLSLIAAGAFWFIPAVKIGTYSAFLWGLFIIAAGMTCLETIANPYATVLGSPEAGPTRINIAQTLNGAGWILGPIVGGHFVFGAAAGANANAGLSSPYLGIGFFVILLLITFAVSPVPELHVEDESGRSQTHNDMKPSGGQQVAIAIVLALVCGLLYFFIAPILGMIWTLLKMNQALFLPVKSVLLIGAYLLSFVVVSRNWDMFRRSISRSGLPRSSSMLRRKPAFSAFSSTTFSKMIRESPGSGPQVVGRFGFCFVHAGPYVRQCGHQPGQAGPRSRSLRHNRPGPNFR